MLDFLIDEISSPSVMVLPYSSLFLWLVISKLYAGEVKSAYSFCQTRAESSSCSFSSEVKAQPVVKAYRVFCL